MHAITNKFLSRHSIIYGNNLVLTDTSEQSSGEFTKRRNKELCKLLASPNTRVNVLCSRQLEEGCYFKGAYYDTKQWLANARQKQMTRYEY